MYGLLLAVSVGSPAEFEVTNYTTGFAVVNRITTPVALTVVNMLPPVPADTSKPAPPGYEWQRWPGENWKLVKLVAAPGVVAPLPFAPSGSAGTTPTTPAIVVAPTSMSLPVTTGMVRTPIFALGAGIVGDTNCTSPFG